MKGEVMAVEKRTRVQFDFSPEAFARLEALQVQTKAVTKAETVRNALKFYEWLVQLEPQQVLEIHETDGKLLYSIPIALFLS
jgi:hypothetical protein